MEYARHVEGSKSDWAKRKTPKKRKYDEIKQDKVQGKDHINHVGKRIKARTIGPDCNCKRLKCFQAITELQRSQILKSFNAMKDKNEQDSHLCGLIALKHITRRRRRQKIEANNNVLKTHCAAFSYKVRIENLEEDEGPSYEQPICLQAFLSLHGITVGRVRRLQDSLCKYGKSPSDKRGKHSNRPTKYPEEIVNLIIFHIQSFKGRQSHYSRRDNPNCVYLPEGLSIKIMHELFVKEHYINVPYKMYWNVFKSKFNIKFGFPRSDTCAECDGFYQKLNSENTSEEQKASLRVMKELHLRKAEAFHVLKRQYKQKAQTGEVSCITFDFMQNLPLPHIPSNPVFYCRQLWYHVFGVHDIGSNEVTIFTYHEGQFKKGANDVTSMLFYYFRHSDLNENLILFSDGCPGQNKNYVMLHFLYILVHCLHIFKSIIYIFPVRGHSYLPNDQDFALIEKQKRKHGIVELPEEWDELIKNARHKPSPFKLTKVDISDMLNVDEATKKYFSKSPKPQIQIKKVKMIKIDKDFEHVFLRDTYSGPWRTSSIIDKKNRLPKELYFPPLYKTSNTISTAKLNNLKSLLEVLSDSKKKKFYLDLFEQQLNSPETDEVDLDNDDNSSGCEN